MRYSAAAVLCLTVVSATLAQQPATQPAARGGRGPTTQYTYPVDPDSRPQEGVPKGTLEGPMIFKSQIFDGTVREYWVYVPAQYTPDKPACVLVFQDGQRATNPRGVLRFGERSPQSGAQDNSRPARFVHVDVSDTTALQFYERSRPHNGRRIRRSAQYNVWRVLTPPPQDVPLAVCDARSVTPGELIAADALFDRDGAIAFSFEAWLLRHDPRQRWAYFSNMNPGEVLLFKTHDTDPAVAHCVPHGAFDAPECPAGVTPRASLEMRGIAYWFD